MGRIEDGSKDKKYFPQSTAKLVQEEAVESTIVGIRANNLPVIIDSLGEESAAVQKEAAYASIIISYRQSSRGH